MLQKIFFSVENEVRSDKNYKEKYSKFDRIEMHR